MDKEVVVTIDRLAFGGDGVGRLEGKVVFVPLAVPGDKIRVRLVEEGARFDRGEIVEVVLPSPDRVQPRCTVFGRCGGCQWQNFSYPAQLKAKEEILKETLERIGKIASPPIRPIIASPDPWGYRHRIQLRRDAEGRIGFFERGSRRVVEFETCEIAAPPLSERARSFKNNGVPPSDAFELSLKGGVVKMEPLDSEERSFCQVNPKVNESLVQVTLEALFGAADLAFTRRWNVVELYSGAGNLTLPIAGRVAKLFSVELQRSSLKEAEEEARANGLQNIDFLVGTAEWGLKSVLRKGIAVDAVLLDPPRQGAKEILDLLAVVKPRVIVYVSCDPATLARDLKFLVARHFDLDFVQPLDMFPQTYHIEAVARLMRRNGL